MLTINYKRNTVQKKQTCSILLALQVFALGISLVVPLTGLNDSHSPANSGSISCSPSVCNKNNRAVYQQQQHHVIIISDKDPKFSLTIPTPSLKSLHYTS